MKRSTQIMLSFLAAIFTTCAFLVPASAGSGTFTITSVTDNGGSPPTYDLDVSSTAGMAVGDHVGAPLSSGAGVYVVTSVVDSDTVRVEDSLTEENGSAFGAPTTGSAWFATPATNIDLSKPPYNSTNWDAALRRNAHLIQSGSLGEIASITTDATGDILINVGGTWYNLPAGTDGQVLHADSTNGNGLAWAADDDTDTLGGLSAADGNFAVGDGSNWVVESGATARTSLGLGSIATQDASSVSITGGSISGITDLPVADGGTGASTAADARTNLGLGSIATQDASSVSITGGSISGITDLGIGDGGTGASTAADARTNLGLAVGSDVQSWNAALDEIAAITTDATGYIIVNINGTWDVIPPGSDGQVLHSDSTAGPGVAWGTDDSTSGLTGPGSSTDNAITRWDGTGGNTVQDSNVKIEDSGQVTWVTGLGAIPHVLGPSDETFEIESGSGRSILIQAGNVLRLFGGSSSSSVSLGAAGAPSLYQGGFEISPTSASASATVDPDGHPGVLVDTSGGAYTITISSPGNGFAADGLIFFVADESGNAGTNNLTVATASTETIDGAASYTISTDYGYVLLLFDGTNWKILSETDTGGGSSSTEPSIAGGRLSLSSSEPVPTSDLSNQTTLYYLPYKGQNLAWYNGTSWETEDITSSGLSITNSGLSVDSNYDVFYDGTSDALELIVWTDDTTRATALTRQDGVLVESGDTDSRYLGTIRTVDDAGAAKFEDSAQKRFVWNVDNQVLWADFAHDGTDSWSEAGNGTWSAINGGAAPWKHEFVIGLDEQPFRAETHVYGDAGYIHAVALDGTSPATSSTSFGILNSSNNGQGVSAFVAYPGIGYHYVQGVETTTTSTSREAFGDNGAGSFAVSSGMKSVGWR